MDAKAKLLRIVANAKGDDLERAEMAFAGLSRAEMDKEHGQSGKSRRWVLSDYRRERAEWQAARDLAASMCKEG